MRKYITYLLYALSYSVPITLLSWLLLGGLVEVAKHGFDRYHAFGVAVVLFGYTSTLFALVWYREETNRIIEEYNEEVRKARLIEKWKP